MNFYPGHLDQRFGHTTYSQHGDDLMLCNIFNLLKIEKPSFIDIGAHHPMDISNTYLLYKYGSRGINVDANPNLMDEFTKHRPEDTNICIGVAPTSGIRTFYMYDDTSGCNSFSEKEVKSLKGIIEPKSAIQIPTVTINDIVNQHCKGLFPALLSMDIEGYDFDVLSSADFSKSAPIVIIVETRLADTQRMCAMMFEKQFIILNRMGENLIFIHKNYHSHALFGVKI